MMWGFTDKYSWIPIYFSGYGAALIFDESYMPKPAYYYVAATFIEHLTRE
ncbi:MAG: endo-1,4-beta-xylanase [Candidatus Bathyarchaeia archaeon]